MLERSIIQANVTANPTAGFTANITGGFNLLINYDFQSI